ncbi:MAG: hypothetical protein A3J69_00870 [Candidatus Levybacteria bacterium RIFCSPHIGHO2_02_FULL_42_12]|nr:MAG: hypothetical protein A2698_01780 [Candidatus Levybacteria bacterium RIFCSPHIGHO2_01_FULL_42_15]OGH31592.1 MAG: hypothetical protein A3J69_00870 [Candidatus Levybacteria bacterium RIFCSPHIGHO2_02_FULL_42_12]OGH42671.1 MAG: hypothetical protein A3B53_02605 [Candidatus Levybacteria bacterium RIFCSPLOWO2_01_FULL_42_15]
MRFLLSLFLGKFIYILSNWFHLGTGSTWPGHVSLMINLSFIPFILSKNPNLSIIVIAGTNGKTTTAKLIQTLLEKGGKNVFRNKEGANLLNGIVSALLRYSTIQGRINYDYAILEVDENTLPLFVDEWKPNTLVLLNLFRDQLDRYGETDTIAQKWKSACGLLNPSSTIIANADDPQMAWVSDHSKAKKLFFGLSSFPKQVAHHAADSLYCPYCSSKLSFSSFSFSHLGKWHCRSCGKKRPEPTVSHSPIYPLEGAYNAYNTHAAILTSQSCGLLVDAKKALLLFHPAFGRQEVIVVKEKKVQLFLSKNPTSFNESLSTAMQAPLPTLCMVLNDQIPDGRDVSWIWDVDMESLDHARTIVISGNRAYDLALRLKYEITPKAFAQKVFVELDLSNALLKALSLLPDQETLFVLPTYSAMLEVRKIVTGRKIL